eukprot:3051624-Pyramimonas_sp.AAC.1
MPARHTAWMWSTTLQLLHHGRRRMSRRAALNPRRHWIQPKMVSSGPAPYAGPKSPPCSWHADRRGHVGPTGDLAQECAPTLAPIGECEATTRCGRARDAPRPHLSL